MLSPVPSGAGQLPESGVAAYSAALLKAMAGPTEVIVLAQKSAPLAPLGTATVSPVWSPSLLVAEQVSDAVCRNRPDLLHVQHEFNLYGGLLKGSLLTLMLIGLRRRGLRIVTTVHGVVAPEHVTKDFITRNALPGSIRYVQMAFRTAYRALAKSSNLLVVHHSYFLDILVQSYGLNPETVGIIQPGAPEANGFQSTVSGMHGKCILALGFLTGYKLPELLVDVAESNAIPDVTFNFCIGANPRINDRKYRERYRRLEERVKSLGSRATWSGYVPDEALAATLDRADVLVLPYTECVSISAVAALAQRSRTPICYSRPLRPLFGPGPLEFELEAGTLTNALVSALSNGAPPASRQFTSWPQCALTTLATWRHLLT
jgi:glycosyltransferase involved in cell wall biosynthesis